jgi:hypothetical protein
MKRNPPIKKCCETCGSEFYPSTHRLLIAKYCTRKCANSDPNKKLKRSEHARKSIVKWTKLNGYWNTGKTKETHPQLSIPGNGKNFGPDWAKGKTKETDKRLKTISTKNKEIIQRMYDNGEIDLTKRKTDYEALGRKVSDTISRKLADGTLKNQYRFVKGWYKRKDGTKEWYESSYEKKYMEILDEQNIKWSKRHGIRIQYFDPTTNKNRYYVPDFLVNENEIHEVKPMKRTTEQKNIAKAQAGTEYCLTNNLKYRIITEINLGIKI